MLGILRTGTGKSLCYQLPAKMLSGITLVVSPLISLMLDQVRECKALFFKEVSAMHSFQSWEERQRSLKQLHKVKLLFVSPELLQNKRVMNHLKQQLQISLFVIDEAHCISQWGYDFRPDYLRLTKVIHFLGDPPVLALTGTATPDVQADIKSKLNRPKMIDHIYPMDRYNISLMVDKVEGTETDKVKKLMHYIDHYQVPTLVYFTSRMRTEQIAREISNYHPERRVAFYHGGMETLDRLKIQQQFMNDQLDVICCTSAFGMGINKHNIRLIIHYHPPTQLESFIQEIGRAGRDGEECLSIVLHRPSDLRIPAQIIENELPNEKELSFVYHRLIDVRTNNDTLPSDDESIETFFMMPVTKWRYLHYQLETHNMIESNQVIATNNQLASAFQSIASFTKKRLTEKRHSLHEVNNWLHTETCLRRELYKPFQQIITEKQTNCCSNCGFSSETWKLFDLDIIEESNINWQTILKNIFMIGEIH